MGNSTKELINAFNLNNYFSDKVNANFTVEGKKIVGLFASNTNTKEYLRRIGEEIIKRHYSGGSEVAHKYYNLNCFPFVLGADLDKEYLDNGIVKVKLADSTNPAVIHNLKIHFANEFKRAVRSKVVARLQKLGVTKEEAYEWIEETVGTRAIGMPYLYYIAFNDEYFKWERECDEDPSETFEMLKEMYIQEFNSRLEACGLKSSDFYEYKDDMLYIKDVSDKVVKSVAKYVKKEVALDFRTPGSIESKVENCKNVLSELILEATGKFVDGYDYDDFTDTKKIRNGSSFALIPFIEENGQLKSLSSRDASKINGVFNKEIPNVDDNFISDIRGKTANPQFANCKEPVYAFSNKQIALLLPKIMESPIAYNERNGRFEFAVDLGNFKRRGSGRSSSKESTPTHLQNGSISRLPNQYLDEVELESPTRSHGGELGRSPRQGSGTGSGSGLLRLVENQTGLAVAGPSARMSSIVVNPGISGPSSQSLSAAQNVSAAWPQEPWSLQSTSGNQWQWPPKPGTSGLSWNKSGSASTSAPSPWSFSGPYVTQKPTFLCDKDSDDSRLPGLLTDERPISRYSTGSGYLGSPGPQQSTPSTEEYNERSASVYSADSGFGSRPQSTFTDTSNYENQEELTEKELIINKFLKNVKEIAAKNIEDLKILTKEKIHEYIEGFAKLEKADQTYQYYISFDKKCFKRESGPKSIFDKFMDNYITVLHSKLSRGGLKYSDFCEHRNDKLYIKDITDINVIKKIAENARMPDRESPPEWTQPRAKAGASNKFTNKNVLPPSKEEKLIGALLDMFNFNNYIGKIHTNFTLEDGKIVSLLGDDVDKREYLQKVRNNIIKKHCGTEEEARKVYDFGQFPFVFPLDSNYEEDEGVTDIAYNVRGAVFNLKIHLIQEFKRDVEDEVIKKLEKEMKKEEVRKCIRRSVHLEKVSNPTSYLCDISFSNEYFQNQSELSEELGIDVETLFKEFKNIYVEEFKSRLKKCNLDVSLVSHDGNMLHIKNAIDIKVVKKVKECAHEEVPVKQFPRKEVIIEVPIVLQDGFYILDTSEIPSETRPPLRQRARPIESTSKAGKGEPKGNQDSGYSSGFVTDAENVSSKAEATTSSGDESMDCENTRKESPKRKFPWSEDEGSPARKSQRSESSSSSSEEAGDSPRSGLSDSQLCKQFSNTQISKR